MGNATLNGLQPGFHNLTVFASADDGIVASSQTVTFTITNPNPPPIAVTVILIPIVLAAAGLLIYRLKKNNGNLLNR